MNMPLVSILVPVYNVEPYIERCARSLLEQTYDNLEFIFCNDCTPDSSMRILDKVVKDYPHRGVQVHTVCHQYNRGISATHNTLLDSAKGEFIVFVDSDDWLELNAVELMVNKQQETHSDIISAPKITHTQDGEKPYFCCGWNFDRDTLLEKVLRKKSSMTLTGRLIRSSLYWDNSIRCIEGVNGDDLQVFPLLLYHAKSVAGIESVLYHYDQTVETSITHRYLSNIRLQHDIITSSRYLIDYFEKNNEPKYVKICEEELVKHIHYLMAQHIHYHKRAAYQEMVVEMKMTNPHFWYLAGWDNRIVRLLEGNWYLMNIPFLSRNIRRLLIISLPCSIH